MTDIKPLRLENSHKYADSVRRKIQDNVVLTNTLHLSETRGYFTIQFSDQHEMRDKTDKFSLSMILETINQATLHLILVNGISTRASYQYLIKTDIAIYHKCQSDAKIECRIELVHNDDRSIEGNRRMLLSFEAGLYENLTKKLIATNYYQVWAKSRKLKLNS